MAWIDDRIWCHTKITDLSDKAFRVWISSIAYSAGLGTKGHLSEAQQRLVGATPRIHRELLTAGLWDQISGESNDQNSAEILIHDWNEHNEKRDARREADRLRKRAQRQMSAGQSNGQSAGTSSGTSTGTARVEGSEGSDIPKDPLRNKVKTEGYACMCGRTFKAERELALHIQNVHDGPPVPLTQAELHA
jgi:AraC-like DNA-binding protein